MIRLALFLLAVMISVVASAKDNSPTIFPQYVDPRLCVSYSFAVKYALKKFGQRYYDMREGQDPIDAGATFELFVNLETGTATLVRHAGEIACVLWAGQLSPAGLTALKRRPTDI